MIEMIAQFWPLLLAILSVGGGALWGHNAAARKAQDRVDMAKAAQAEAERKAAASDRVAARAVEESRKKEEVHAQVSAAPADDLRRELLDKWSRD